MKSLVKGTRAAAFLAAMIYFASFPLVGWHFLLPGRFTFGVLCCLGLVVLGGRCTSVVPEASMRRLVAYVVAYSVLVLIVGVVLDAALIDSKDYFIVGLPLSVAVAITVAVSQWRHRTEVTRISLLIRKLGGMWVLLLVGYFAFRYASDYVEAQRFFRIQCLMLPLAMIGGFIVSVVVQKAAPLEASRNDDSARVKQ